MDWFMHHAVLLGLVGAGVAVAYGLYLTWWLLKQPAGNERMREISAAVQEGAAAYLRKQYTTIAIVAVVPFILLGVYNKLGWGTAFGFLIGAVLSSAAGFIGMNVAVRSNVRTAEAARNGLAPALNVAFRAGSVTGLLVVGLGLFGVTGYYWFLTAGLNHSPIVGDPRSRRPRLRRLADLRLRPARRRHLHEGRRRRRRPRRQDRGGHPRGRPAQPGRDRRQRRRQRRRLRRHGGRPVRDLRRHGGRRDAARRCSTPTRRLYLYPLALGAISAVSSVIGTFFARLGRGDNAVINALYKAVLVATVLSAVGFIPITMAFDSGKYGFTDLYVLGARRPGRHVPARRDHRVLHRHPLEPGQGDRQGIADRPRDEHHRRPRRSACRRRRLPVIVIVAGILVAHHFAGLLGIGVAVMAQLSMTGLIVALDAYGPVTDNAGGIAEMADLPEGVRGDHRPARRRRQHDEGGHEGLRDRLRRARRARPVRLVHDRPERPGPARTVVRRCPTPG